MKKPLLLVSILLACFLLLDSQQPFAPALAKNAVTAKRSNAPRALVTIGGRIQNASGRGVYHATVSLIDSNNQVVTAISNPFGYYRFFEVETGATYTVSVSGKGYRFTPQQVSVSAEDLSIDFTAQ